MSKVNKIVLGLPWYSGPDIDCYPEYFEMMSMLGRIRERSLWYEALRNTGEDSLNQGVTSAIVRANLPPLDPYGFEGGNLEITPEDGVFEFAIANQTRLSLPGLARERLVDTALQWGADWLFMWDADMKFNLSTLLRLWRHNKPVVNALGFTSRDPIMPCLYRIKEGWDVTNNVPSFNSEIVWDIPEKTLITDEDIDGEIAFGAGITLINMNVFKQVPKPWFNSTGCGEDWFFCVRCRNYNVPRYVDTSIQTLHKAHKVSWYGADAYREARKNDPATYEKMINKEVLT